MIWLDTNVVIALLNNRPAGPRLRFEEVRALATPVFLTIVVYHELTYGAAASERRLGLSRAHIAKPRHTADNGGVIRFHDSK